jgi:hypothetical protein
MRLLHNGFKSFVEIALSLSCVWPILSPQQHLPWWLFCWLRNSQNPYIWFILRKLNPIRTITPYFSNTDTTSHLRLDLPSDLMPWRFPKEQFMYISCFPKRATYPTYLILHHVITIIIIIIIINQYQLRSSSSCKFLQYTYIHTYIHTYIRTYMCMCSYQPEGWLDPHTVLAPDAHTHTSMHTHIPAHAHAGTHS